MKVVFRADASTRMGTGHVTRCATLAAALQARGAQTSMICREHEGNLIAALREATPVSVLTAPNRSHAEAGDDYAEWLGLTESADADEAVAALHGDKPDWLVVDNYALGTAWEQRLRPHAARLMVIDDLADRAHDCDALLDQNFSAEGERRHQGLVPRHCRLMVGPRFALLAPVYASHHRSQRPRDGQVRRVLVYFGGADPSNLSGQALTALSAPEFSDLDVDLVIGTNHPQREALGRQADARPRTSTYGTRPDLADLMEQADLAVGAGGGTTWERMCLGLPSLVVSLAENQRSICESLAAAGLIAYLGNARSIGAAQIREGLRSLVADPERLVALSSRGRQLVDGLGASRVADVMLGRAGDPIRTRNALHEIDASPEGFEAFTFAWIDRCSAGDVLALRNRPHVTAQMRSQAPIASEDHQRFLAAYDRLDRYDFILIDNSSGRPVGAFYVTNLGASPEIGKYIGDPAYLGKGIAHKATQRLVDFCRSRAELRQLTSMTRQDNLLNIALNTSLGFRPVRSEGAYLVMALEL